MRIKGKRIISMFLSFLMAASTLSGCASLVPDSDVAHADENGTKAVVTLADTEHGSLCFLDPDNPEELLDSPEIQVDIGTKLVVIAEPDPGYVASRFLVEEKDGSVDELDTATGVLVLDAEKSCTISAEFSEWVNSADGNKMVLDVDTESGTPDVLPEADYILENADSSLAGSGASPVPMNWIRIVHTYVDGTMLPDATLDKLWVEDKDNDGVSDNAEACLGQQVDDVLLYSLSDDAEYFVGKTGSIGDGMTVSEWLAGYNDMTGNTVDDIIYDGEKNLVYVPKHYQNIEGYDGIVLGATKLQLLCSVGTVGEASHTVDVVIDNDGVKGEFVESGTASGSLINPYTELFLTEDGDTARKFRLDLIDSVTVNGIEYKNPSDMWDFDDETCLLTVYMSPAVVDSVEVSMSDGFLKKLKNMFAFGGSDALTAKAAMGSYVMDTVWLTDVPPEVGMRAQVTATVGYAAHADTAGAAAQAGAAWGGITGPVTDATLTAMIMAGLNATSLDVSNVTPYGGNQMNYLVMLAGGDYAFGDMIAHMDPSTLTVACAHIGINSNFTLQPNINTPTAQLSEALVTVVNTEYEAGSMNSGWLYFTVVIPTTHNQAGIAIFKVRWSSEYERTGTTIIQNSGYGKVRVKKTSADLSCTAGNSAYSMVGAEYGIYQNGTHVDSVFVQGEDGWTGWSNELPAGQYTVREIAPSTGYTWNPNQVSFTIMPTVSDVTVTEIPNGTGGYDYNLEVQSNVEVEVEMTGDAAEIPMMDPLAFIVQKKIIERPTGEPQGDIEDLSGIKFRIEYYAGLYNSRAEAEGSGRLRASAVFATNELGKLTFATSSPVDGTSWLYHNTFDPNINVIPHGTVVVTEVSCMDGLYVTGQGGHVFQIVDSGDHATSRRIVLESWPYAEFNSDASNNGGVAVFQNSEPWLGQVRVWKADAAGNRSLPQGDGSLAGITYSIRNDSLHPVVVNHVTYDVGQEIMKITTVKYKTANSECYYAETPERWLPYGSYLIDEVSANDSYHMAEWHQRFEIRTDGQTVEFSKNNNWNRDSVKRGGVRVVKADWDTHRSEPQGDATLAGVKYDIYNRSTYPVFVNGAWYDPDVKIMTIDTSYIEHQDRYLAETGETTLPYGTYEILEVKPGTGYHIWNWRQTFQIRSDRQLIQYVADASNWNRDEVFRGGVTVIKADADWHACRPQGDAALSTVTYEITNRSEHSIWLESTKREYKPGEVVMTIQNAWDPDSERYIATTGEHVLPYGTYDIEEVAVSEGYNNARWKQQFTIRRDYQMMEYDSVVMQWNENAVKRGGIIIGKVDRETGQYISLGEATLADATFEIVNRSKQPVYVNGKTYKPGEVVMHISTEQVEHNGRSIYAATTGNYCLPYGTYDIYEVGTGTGYLFDSTSRAYIKTFEIREHGQMIDLTDEQSGSFENRAVVSNQVLREDFHFKKKAEDTMERMESVAFLVTSKTTGERHVIVTDENGIWGSAATDAMSSDSKCVPHTQNTNANDPTSPNSNGALGVDADGNWYVKDSSKLDCDAGVWFTGMPEDMTDWINGLTYRVNGQMLFVGDSLRAFPYDTYVVEELPCDANKDYKLVRFTVTLHRYTADHDGIGLDVDYGTIDDQRIFVDTCLKFDYIDKIIPNGPDVTITDTVVYGGFEPGNYTLKGELHLLNADGTDGGIVTRSEKTFTVGSEVGSTEMPFTLDTTSLGGRKLVAFEYFYKNGALYGQHAEIDDPDQTVTVLEISTTLTGNLDHMTQGDADIIELTDTITYNGLEPGKRYTIEGTLVDKETGKAIKDANGYPVTVEERYTPHRPSGTVDIVFTFRGIDMQGKTVVAFETISRNGLEYAVHADLNDEAQTVWIPSVDTFAADAADGNKEIAEAQGQSIRDAVKMTNLKDGYSYKLTGELHSRVDGEDIGILKDADGVAYTAETTWTGNNGSQAMTFTGIDASGLGGTDIVVFQTLYGRKNDSDSWMVLGFHRDITDEDQSVHVPHIGTVMLTDGGLHEIQVPEDGIVTLTDTVAYKNVLPGHEYVLYGTLQLPDGSAVSAASTAFTPADSDGETDVVFMFDAGAYSGKTVTAYEYLYSSPAADIPAEWQSLFGGLGGSFNRDNLKDEWIAAWHSDIADADQTVHFAEIGTTMTADNGEHMVQVTDNGYVTLTDVVDYKNLIPGNTYTVTGTLYERETGLPVEDEGGNALTEEYTFVPANPDGEVTILFTFDASELIGKTVVAFESISRDGVEFAVHADITDEAQSVHFVEIGTAAVTENGLHIMQLDKERETVEVTDTVEYENLIPGVEYTMSGTLHYQGVTTSGTLFDGGAVKDADGEDLVVSKTFVPETPDGSVEIVFSIDAADAVGRTLTAYETLLYGDVAIAVHEDITEEGQSVHFADIRTTMLSENGSHFLQLDEEAGTVTLMDTVYFTNLIPGLEYTIDGTLHLQGVDEDGNIIDAGTVNDIYGDAVTGVIRPQPRPTEAEEDADGETVPEETAMAYLPTGQRSFVPYVHSGYVDILFTFDASELQGMTVTAFEHLSLDGAVILTHEDITDEGQTVHFVDMGTTAQTKSGLHIIQAGESDIITITDTVSYTNLVPGRYYNVRGTLHIQTRDLAGNIVDGGELLDADGNPVVSNSAQGPAVDGGTLKDEDGNDVAGGTSFLAEAADGTIDITFTIDASRMPEGFSLGGKTVVAFETMSADGIEFAAHADITDEAQAVHFVKIGTTALTEDESHAEGKSHEVRMKDGEDRVVTITDTVAYENAIPGLEYVMVGELHVLGTDEEGNPVDKGIFKDKDGKKAVTTAAFIPEKPDGSIEMAFEVDTADMPDGGTLVVFETMTYLKSIIAVHEDITDEGQSITFILPVKVRTTAVTENGTHFMQIPNTGNKTVTITDTVAYENVIPGQEYTLVGTVHIQSKDRNGEIKDGGILKNEDGETIRAEYTFKPEKASGTVDMEFKVDTSKIIDGATLVVFETMSLDGNIVAAHEDITDENQSVTYTPDKVVKIRTTARTKDGGQKIELVEDEYRTITIIDTVAYEDVVPGREYTVKGTLHIQGRDCDGKLVDRGALTDKDGNVITSEVTFKPKESKGTIDVEFEVSTALFYHGGVLVAFETMSCADYVVATHNDITDKDQSIRFIPDEPIEIGTTALTGDKTHTAEFKRGESTTVTITDTVSYKNLAVGRKYTLEGTLHVQTYDRKGNVVDGGELKDKDGKPITADITFKPSKSDGTAEVVFKVDTALLPEGGTVVVFEKLSWHGHALAAHEDITDKNQAVTFVPKDPDVHISTTATVNGSHTVQMPETGTKTVIITDTVAYDGVIPGRAYTLTGVLHIQSSGRSCRITDGGVLKGSNGRAVTSEVTFTPKSEKGTVEVEFRVDTSLLPEGGTLVVFESMSYKGEVVAVHEDITDTNQSVRFEAPKKPEPTPTPTTKPDKPQTPVDIVKTGEGDTLVVGTIGLALLAGCGYLFFTKTAGGRKALKKIREKFRKK